VEGELSHPLSFLDEVPRSGLMDEDLALDFEPAPRELPPAEEETEVPPPSGAWDQLLEPSPPEAWRGADGVSDEEQAQGEHGEEEPFEAGRGPGAGVGEVPLWELEPEIPVWHREADQGTPPPDPVEGADVDNLFHRVVTGSGDQRRQAAEALRSYAGPTLNPRLLDELSNGVLDLLRDGPGAAERGGLSLDLARELATPGVSSRLVARLGQEQNREVRRELVGLFGRLGEPMGRALVDALAEETDRASRRNYLEGLMGMGPEGVSAVNRMLNDARWFVVRNGLTILGEMGDEGAVGRVAPVLVHSDPRVRREAVATLARLGGEQADRLVEQRLSDPSPEVRSAAAAGVGLRRIGRAREALQGMLASETESSVLEAVMGALGALGDATSVPALEKKAAGSFLSRPPREIRIAAYRALQAIGTPHARSIVEAGRKDRDPEIRAALERFGGSPPHS
jgi:HEAT repeat protein